MTAPSPRSGLSVRRYQDGDQGAIARFNARLRAGGSPHVLYEEPAAAAGDLALPRERLFVVADGDELRGGAFLRELPLTIGADSVTIGLVKYPVAESLVDKAFAGVPVALLVHLMRVQPKLAALGMGGHSGPFAQLLARLKWHGDIVASWIAPVSPHVVAGQLPHLRHRAPLRMASTLARYTGMAVALGLGYRTMLRIRQRLAMRSVAVQAVSQFDARDDQLWRECAASYSALTCRDAHALNWRYAGSEPGLRRIRIEQRGTTVGWAVLQIVDLRGTAAASQYGHLVLGMLCDALAAPAHIDAVMAAAMHTLMNAKVDLALANQSHPLWQRALQRHGFVRGPENFAFYRAPALERELDTRGVRAADVFIARGDDGLFAQ